MAPGFARRFYWTRLQVSSSVRQPHTECFMKVHFIPWLAVSLSVASTACRSPVAAHYAVVGSVSGPLLFRREGGPVNDSIRGFVIRRVNGRYPGSQNGQVLWSVESRVALPAPDSIIYGLPPAGFVSGVALPLTP